MATIHPRAPKKLVTLLAVVSVLAVSSEPAAGSGLVFEVASVRLAPPDLLQSMTAAVQSGRAIPVLNLRIDPPRVYSDGVPLKALISQAYAIDGSLIAGPGFVTDADVRIAIQAKMPAGTLRGQVPEMLRSLLEERFHLIAHRGLVKQTGYSLVVGKSGPKLRPPMEIDKAVCTPWLPSPVDANALSCVTNPVTPTGSRERRSYLTASKNGPLSAVWRLHAMTQEFFAITMPQLSEVLTEVLSSGGAYSAGGELVQVANETGLAGRWHVVIESRTTETDTPLSSISESLAIVGLRLQRTTVEVEKLFIDSVDKVPTEN